MNPTIKWRDIKNQRFLHVLFEGELNVTGTQNAVSKIKSMLTGDNSVVTMVWECTHMTDFDKNARDIWQQFIKDIRPNIKATHLVSDKLLIRTGARVIGAITGMKIILWSSSDEFTAGC